MKSGIAKFGRPYTRRSDDLLVIKIKVNLYWPPI